METQLARGLLNGAVFCLLSLLIAGRPSRPVTLTAQEIVSQSVQATYQDWKKAPGFDFCESDRDSRTVKTYQVLMLAGSPYKRLVAVNGKQISDELQQQEAENFRSHRADEEHKKAVQYEKERQRDQRLLNEFTSAMEYEISGTGIILGHQVYVVEARPRANYVPKDLETQVLSGMRGRLWIDQTSFHLVKAQAEVIRPVMVAGFVARIETGTRFELEEAPIDDSGIWLPSRFAMQERAKILLLFPKSSWTEKTYFHYRPTGSSPLEGCAPQ